MKQTLMIVGLLIAGVAWTGNAMAEIRIATIQSQRLIKESPQYKKMEAQMKADFERRAKELEQDGKSLSEDLQEFKRNADVMSAAERARTEKDLNTRRIDFNYAERKFREDVAAREKELAQTLMNQISEVIEAVAKEGSYDLVLQDPVFASEAVDVTAKVLARLEAAN
ncbi:OmpH family outer membrane protein [uncultured Abyssibacter sp.]|uniref:OmpH family outer membrane protein n=1 Tax=uncultured Abyssibacter sp. TaxID=2320202 RepID=UPI0032B2B678